MFKKLIIIGIIFLVGCDPSPVIRPPTPAPALQSTLLPAVTLKCQEQCNKGNPNCSSDCVNDVSWFMQYKADGGI